MTLDVDIEYLCRCLEGIVSISDTPMEVKYFNGKKPAAPILFNQPQYEQEAWFAEIFVNGLCVFSESYIPDNNDWEHAEKTANNFLLKSVFNYGVSAANMDLKKLYERIYNTERK